MNRGYYIQLVDRFGMNLKTSISIPEAKKKEKKMFVTNQNWMIYCNMKIFIIKNINIHQFHLFFVTILIIKK